MRPGMTGLSTIVILALLPTLVCAEVMDKEPTALELWAVGILWGLAGLFAWRRHVVLGIVVTLLGLPLVWGFHWELTNPYIGPAIRREAGQGYAVHAYLSMGLCFALHLIGVTRRFSRYGRPATSTEGRGE